MLLKNTKLLLSELNKFENPTVHLSHIPSCTILNRNMHISVHCGVWDRYSVGYLRVVYCCFILCYLNTPLPWHIAIGNMHVQHVTFLQINNQYFYGAHGTVFLKCVWWFILTKVKIQSIVLLWCKSNKYIYLTIHLHVRPISMPVIALCLLKYFDILQMWPRIASWCWIRADLLHCTVCYLL